MNVMSLRAWLAQMPLVAILRGVHPDEVVQIGRHIVSAGFKLIEVPLNSPDPLRSIALLAREFGDKVAVGAGTVTRTQEVAAVRDVGGRLIVMPHASVEIVSAARAAGLLALPGFFTPSEALEVLAAGADGLKLFPAGRYGPHGLAGLRAVLPDETLILPVGGVHLDDVAAYWDAGAAGFGLGSALYAAGADAAEVGRRARRFVRQLDRARHEHQGIAAPR